MKLKKMKRKNIMIIAIISIAVIGSVYFFTSSTLFSLYKDPILLARYADNMYEKAQEYPDVKFHIIKLTEENLQQAPVIKGLIEESLRKNFEPNQTMILVSTELPYKEYFKIKQWNKELEVESNKPPKSAIFLEYNGDFFALSFPIIG